MRGVDTGQRGVSYMGSGDVCIPSGYGAMLYVLPEQDDGVPAGGNQLLREVVMGLCQNKMSLLVSVAITTAFCVDS